MRRVAMILVGLVVIGFGLWQLRTGVGELTSGGGDGGKVGAAAAAAGKAAGALAVMAKGSELSGTPPRQTDPQVKALLDAVFDTAALDSGQPLPFSQLESINQWTLATVRTGGVYLLAGTGLSDFSHGLDDPKVQQQANRNVATFAPEIGRYLDAQLRLLAAEIDTVGALAAKDPEKMKNPQSQSGLAKMRAGIATTLGSTLGMLTTPGLSDQWRRERLPALLAIAPKAGPFLTPEDGRALHKMALDVAQGMADAEVQAQVKTIAGFFPA